jgi:hypothetical protein
MKRSDESEFLLDWEILVETDTSGSAIPICFEAVQTGAESSQ